MLSPYRVLDLTDFRGEIGGMMLGDLGADVIRVEPLEGSAARRAGPLLDSGPEPERSLQFAAYNRNKRSIVLDLAPPGDRATFDRLVASADFVLDSAPGGLLDAHDISFEALRALQPRIVVALTTPFGSDGPHAGLAASDLTIAAMGGPVALQGTAERPPVRVSTPQVWRHAGAEMAVAALVAHARMLRTGDAQLVDVSAQAAMTWTTLNAMSAAGIQGRDFERNGSMLQLGTITLPLVYACADGHVVAIPSGRLMQSLVDWMVDDGVVDASWGNERWDDVEVRMLAGEALPHTIDDMIGAFGRFFAGHKKTDLFERALAIGATIAPVQTIEDLLAFPHLVEREFWTKATLADGQRVDAPGLFAKSSTPLEIRRPAPRLGEHGDEIRSGLAADARPPAAAPAPDGEALPFAGLKVADFSWIGVGPMSAKYLADHGATVVRVESESRPDALRGVGPFKDNLPGWDRSHFFAEMNASKQGLLLDLKQPAAIEVAKRLVAWADVFIESFTPGAVARMGLGYDDVRRMNPRIVMMSTCLMGQTGPAASMAGYGYHAGAVAGFYELTGWPDLDPDGPWMAYTDVIAPRFVGSTLLAAIDHQRRTGEGRHIDGAQLEMGLHFLAPEILESQVSGHRETRRGNRARDAAPQGAYPCAGTEQWCAIAVDTDAQWLALRGALGDPAWAREPALDRVAGRIAQHDAIDAAIAAWTRAREPQAVMDTLQAAGVPAGIVQRSSDLLRDPQYAHRGFYRTLEHGEMGSVPYAGHQFRIRGYDSGPRSAAPTLGQHSFEVLQRLGYTDDEIAGLMGGGAIT